MFERYTERARRVLFFARYESSQLGSPSIESEHLLLGLIREGHGFISRILARSNLTFHDIRMEIERRTEFREKFPTSVEIPFSASTRRILQFAVEEADALSDQYIGTEHLLLGLLREERSVGATILMEKGMRLDAVRQNVLALRNERKAPQVDADPLARLAEENARLRTVIRRLEEERGSSPLQFRDNAYWIQPEPVDSGTLSVRLAWGSDTQRGGDDYPDGPFCPTCWDVDRRLVRKLTRDNGESYCDYCTHYRPRP